VKRKQELLRNCDTAKQPRSTPDDVITIDKPLDRSVDSCDGLVDTATKATQLRTLLEHERKQSNDFEAYLRQVLSDVDCQITSPSRSSTAELVCDSSNVSYSLSEKISHLQSTVQSEREANRLFELKLMQMCPYD